MSSAGAAAASAAAKRRGAASRKATLQARAPEEDTLADHVQRCKSERALLARRPGHRTPAEQMEMQMIHALPTVLTGVDHGPIARFGNLLLPGDRRRE